MILTYSLTVKYSEVLEASRKVWGIRAFVSYGVIRILEDLGIAIDYTK